MPSGFMHSSLSFLPLISQVSQEKPCRGGNNIPSSLKEHSKRQGFGPGAHGLGRQRTQHALLRLAVFRLFPMAPLPGQSLLASLRESAPVSSLNTRIPVSMVCDHTGVGGGGRAGALHFTECAGSPYPSRSLPSD